jgi:hypothetical protein
VAITFIFRKARRFTWSDGLSTSPVAGGGGAAGAVDPRGTARTSAA